MNIKKTLYIYQAQLWHIPFPLESGRWDVHMIGQTTELSTGPVLAYILSSASQLRLILLSINISFGAYAADPRCCRDVLPLPFDFYRSKKACQSKFPRQDVDQTHDANLGCCRTAVPLQFSFYCSKEKAPQSTFLAKMSTKQFPTSRSDMDIIPWQ